MSQRERFFIFSWKEVLVLTLLGMIIMGFSFTLGLHYGKKMHEVPVGENDSAQTEAKPEAMPSKEVLEEAQHHAGEVTEDSIEKETEKAVVDSGIRTEVEKPVDLPSEKVSEKKAKAEEKETTTKAPAYDESKKASKEKKEESTASSGEDSYAIQLGSFPTDREAQELVRALAKKTLKAEVVKANVQGQVRHRVVIGGFKMRASAEVRAREWKSQKKIETFVIIKN